MISDSAALLDALADCLQAGDTLVEAVEKVGAVEGAGDWARQARPPARAGAAVADVLRQASRIDADERSLLSAEGAGVPAALRAVVLRRRRGLARRRAIRWAMVGPFGFGALTVALDPLPNLVTGGAYLEPVLRGLFVLAVVALAIVAGVPALLRAPRARSVALRLCAAVPGVRRLAALYAEEELTAALAPFAEGGEVRAAGLAAAASLLAWSPLGATLRAAARTVRPAPRPPPMGGLEPLARQLSPATGLAVVGGVASKRLAERLTQRGDAIARVLTARLRLALRVVAYTLVVAFSVNSLANMISRGLPGMPAILGGATSPDQKQLEDLLKQLE